MAPKSSTAGASADGNHKKRKRVVLPTNADTLHSQMGDIGNNLEQKQIAYTLSKISTILSEKPQVALKVLFHLETGTYEGKVAKSGNNMDEKLPSTSNQWNLIHRDVVVSLLEILVSDAATFKNLKNMNKPDLVEVLCFALHAEPTSKVYSKFKAKLFQEAQLRVNFVGGNRLGQLSFTQAPNQKTPTVQWGSGCGFFSVSGDKGEQALSLLIPGGTSVQTKMPDQMQHEDWDIASNGSFRKAALKSGMYEMPCLKLFTKASVEGIVAPESMDAVPREPSSSPSAPSCATPTASPAGSSASSAMPQTPNPPEGWGGAPTS